ncbi:hypothetical protein Tco_0661090 [Tanacetum coccineum]
MEESLSKFMNESVKRHEENSNLIKEIQASTNVPIRIQGASIKTLEIQIGKISKVLQERGFRSLPSSTETNPRDHVKLLLTTIEADMSLIRRIGSSQYAVSAQRNRKVIFKLRQATILFPIRLNDYYCDEKGSYEPQYLDAYSCRATRLNDSLPRKEKEPGSLGELAHTKLTVELADRIVKHPNGIVENVLVGIEHMELDLEARLMGETLVLNRSLDPLYRDYIKLNDLIIPLELRRNQADDLMPTIKEGEVVDKPMIGEVKTRNDNKMVTKMIGYPSGYDEDEKIRIGYAYNLKFSCMIGFEFVHANFFPNLPINVMSKKFYNSIMKDNVEFRRRNGLGNFANVLVFIQKIYVISDFTVVEDMDPYLDEGMGEVVVGEPFCEVSCVET